MLTNESRANRHGFQVSIPLISGLHADAYLQEVAKDAASLNPFDFRASCWPPNDRLELTAGVSIPLISGLHADAS